MSTEEWCGSKKETGKIKLATFEWVYEKLKEIGIMTIVEGTITAKDRRRWKMMKE